MLLFTSVSNSLRLNKHVRTSEHWLLPWQLRKCLELLEEMQSNRLIPLRVQLHFEVAHCEANPWNFEFVHSTFNLPERKMLCNCIELIFNDPQQQDQICSLGRFFSNHTENFESRWLIGADRAGGIRPFDEGLRGIRKSQHSWLHGDRGGTLGHGTLMENKEKWSTD